ncbi:MAG: phage integrase central domain-containing protein [Fimbriimonadales bacterium]
MATYKKERNLWEARRRLPGGLRKSFYAQTESAAELLADAATGQNWNSSKTPTFEQFALLVYAPTLIQHSQKWRQQVAWALDKHLTPRFGKLRIASIDRHILQSFLTQKLSELSHSSVGHLRKVLHAVFALAEVDEIISKNPIKAVRLPPVRVQPIEPPGDTRTALHHRSRAGQRRIPRRLPCGHAGAEARRAHGVQDRP